MNTHDARLHLQRWLQEYTVWTALEAALPVGGEEGLSEVSGEDAVSAAPLADSAAPEAGQIRLWPSVTGECGPMYGLLVAPSYGSWGVLPFSPLSLPAVPEELTVMEAPPLRVVQGWNLRRIPADAARGSWCVGALPEAERFRVDLFLTVCAAGGPLPPILSGRVGPPLVHPLDPRYAYRDAERTRVSLSLGEASLPEENEGFPLARAAEPPPDYDPV